MRKPIIAGNWKMYNTPSKTRALIDELKPLVAGSRSEVVVCPPFVCLPAAKEAIEGTDIKLGAQDMYWENEGAFTGEVSPEMLKEVGVEYVIIGHSERRQYFSETDATVNKKTMFAIKNGLVPIVCVGETLTQREQGITMQLVESQVTTGLAGLDGVDPERLVIAYEPVWAIGTGRTASSRDADEVIRFIRQVLGKMFTREFADRVRILYGGSVKADNASELMNMPDIDGGLVGGASLKAKEFSRIVNF
jgi:triosephosphate isomerase